MKIRRAGEATLRSYCKLETTVEYKNSKTMLQNILPGDQSYRV